MFKNIIQDYLLGIVNSLRLDLLIHPLYHNMKLRKLFYKICKYNFILHFFPLILVQLLESIFHTTLTSFLSLIIYPINLFTVFFHILHYMDLVNIVCIYTKKTSKVLDILELLSLAITISIYQIVIYLTTTIIYLIFYDNLYFLAVCTNFIILTIYHSFYCFNNLWQYKHINMSHRIDMHEKLWPYYLGYGTIATIIYTYTRHPYFMGFYNIYMALIIAIPFLTKTKYPTKENLYPKINLTIFSYMTSNAFYITEFIINYLCHKP